jgi:hypothetical protein
MNDDRKTYWLDDPRHVKWIVWTLAVVCLALVGSELFFHKHGHFGWQEIFGFDAWFGFVSFCLIVLSGWPLGKLLRRDEDYYDR